MSADLRLAIATAMAVAAVGAPAHAATNIIDTTYGAGAGSFELGRFTPLGTGSNNFQSLLAGATSLTGWTIGGVGIDWISTPFYGARDGIHAVDLGYYTGGAGSVSTSIATVTGATYNLAFSAAAVAGLPIYTNAGHVSAGSLAQQAFAPAFSAANNFTNQQYTDYSYNFTALSGVTTIVFSADVPGTGYGPVIDKVSASLVSLPSAVPEPATWTMMLVGFGIVGGAMRKRSMVRSQAVEFAFA